jgi:hypothetical protein
MLSQFIFFLRSEIICFCSRIIFIISFIFYSMFLLALSSRSDCNYFSLYSCSRRIAYNFEFAYSSNSFFISYKFLLAYSANLISISERFLFVYCSNSFFISERFLLVSYLAYVNFCYSKFTDC